MLLPSLTYSGLIECGFISILVPFHSSVLTLPLSAVVLGVSQAEVTLVESRGKPAAIAMETASSDTLGYGKGGQNIS